MVPRLYHRTKGEAMLTEEYLQQMAEELWATQAQEDADELAAWYWENLEDER